MIEGTAAACVGSGLVVLLGFVFLWAIVQIFSIE